MTNPDQPVRLACDMSAAPDTPAERLAEYRHLFHDDLLERVMTGDRLRLTFADRDGLGEQLHDLADREQSCCQFFRITVSRSGPRALTWEMTVTDPAAVRFLEAFYELSGDVGASSSTAAELPGSSRVTPLDDTAGSV